MKSEADGKLHWDVIVETQAHCRCVSESYCEAVAPVTDNAAPPRATKPCLRNLGDLMSMGPKQLPLKNFPIFSPDNFHSGAERCAEHKGKPGDVERHDHPSALSSQLSTERNQRTKASQSFN